MGVGEKRNREREVEIEGHEKNRGKYEGKKGKEFQWSLRFVSKRSYKKRRRRGITMYVWLKKTHKQDC